MEDMAEELTDRFGDIPKKVEKLLEVAALKAQAHQLYVTAVEQKGEVYTFIMYEKAKVHPERIPKLIEDFRGELTFKADGAQPCFIYEKKEKKSEREADRCTGNYEKCVKWVERIDRRRKKRYN